MKTKIEDGHLVLDFDGEATVKLNLYRMFESFNRDERSAIADALCWNDRLEILAKVEDRLLSGYKWSTLRELNELSKNMHWKMYHDPQRWLTNHGFESNYTDKIESHEAFTKMVEKKLESMRGPKEATKEVPDEIPY